MSDAPPGFDSAISVRFALDGAEWARAARAAYLALPGVRSFRVVLRTAPIAMLLPPVAAWFLGYGPIGGIIPALVGCEGAALFVLVFEEVWSRVLPRLDVGRMRRDADDVVLEERWISERGLFVRGNEETTFLPWSLIAWVRETPEFLLFRGPAATHFIPKRLLGDNDLARARELAASVPTEAVQGSEGRGRLAAGGRPAPLHDGL